MMKLIKITHLKPGESPPTVELTHDQQIVMNTLKYLNDKELIVTDCKCKKYSLNLLDVLRQRIEREIFK